MQRACDGVDGPAEDRATSGPGAVTGAKLFEGDGLLPKRVVGGTEWPKDIVNGVEERTAYSAAVVGLLGGTDEVVDKHVNVSQGVGLSW